jgi:glycosyltransferase involved in cell wall biosynthesis
MKPLLSVIIATHNRPRQLKDCLKSILGGQFTNFEIIVIDQGDNKKTREILNEFLERSIQYFKIEGKGKGKGINLGVQKSEGEILAFTDDDCLVAKDWLKNIWTAFKKNQKISGVFGKVLPYRPKLHKDEICPCTFFKNKKKLLLNRVFIGKI